MAGSIGVLALELELSWLTGEDEMMVFSGFIWKPGPEDVETPCVGVGFSTCEWRWVDGPG